MKHYFTGKPCKYGHVAERFVSNDQCTTCASEMGRRYRLINLEKTREHQRAWRESNRDKAREKYLRWLNKNVKAARMATAEWKKANPGRVTALNRFRALIKRNRTPAWADLQRIRAVYESAARMTRELGIKMHVDHVVPLRGLNVSGLHVHENLQIITAYENCAKGRRFP